MSWCVDEAAPSKPAAIFDALNTGTRIALPTLEFSRGGHVGFQTAQNLDQGYGSHLGFGASPHY